ncbi:uncharacterized protein L969DRAFT_22433 [Mixia osmundae IAM 14324]|nr:uncharacterized protein L969DRAFT_22433 [Mixia osmundae IAM 14324]KEI40466.1 hypothetical protein L969DRAFT_22433 [Mixia osmundae IAM 14324]
MSNESLQASIRGLQTSLAQTVAQCSDHEATISSLQTRLYTAEARLSAAETSVRDAEGRTREESDKVVILRNKLEEARRAIMRLQDDLQAARALSTRRDSAPVSNISRRRSSFAPDEIPSANNSRRSSMAPMTSKHPLSQSLGQESSNNSQQGLESPEPTFAMSAQRRASVIGIEFGRPEPHASAEKRGSLSERRGSMATAFDNLRKASASLDARKVGRAFSNSTGSKDAEPTAPIARRASLAHVGYTPARADAETPLPPLPAGLAEVRSLSRSASLAAPAGQSQCPRDDGARAASVSALFSSVDSFAARRASIGAAPCTSSRSPSVSNPAGVGLGLARSEGPAEPAEDLSMSRRRSSLKTDSKAAEDRRASLKRRPGSCVVFAEGSPEQPKDGRFKRSSFGSGDNLRPNFGPGDHRRSSAAIETIAEDRSPPSSFAPLAPDSRRMSESSACSRRGSVTSVSHSRRSSLSRLAYTGSPEDTESRGNMVPLESLEAVSEECARLREQLAQAEEAREASETCLRALRDYISSADAAPAEKALQLPPLPTDSDDVVDEFTQAQQPSKTKRLSGMAWGTASWIRGSVSSVVVPPTPVLSIPPVMPKPAAIADTSPALTTYTPASWRRSSSVVSLASNRSGLSTITDSSADSNATASHKNVKQLQLSHSQTASGQRPGPKPIPSMFRNFSFEQRVSSYVEEYPGSPMCNGSPGGGPTRFEPTSWSAEPSPTRSTASSSSSRPPSLCESSSGNESGSPLDSPDEFVEEVIDFSHGMAKRGGLKHPAINSKAPSQHNHLRTAPDAVHVNTTPKASRYAF